MLIVYRISLTEAQIRPPFPQTTRAPLPSCHPSKTIVVTETIQKPCKYWERCVPTVTTIKVPPCPTSTTPTPTVVTSIPASITPAPTPTSTGFGTLCPHYCLVTSTVLPTEPWKCPPLIGGCDAIVFETATRYCNWCPTMSCASLRTVTEQFSCPPTFVCPETSTEWDSCTHNFRPSGYTFTIG